MGYVRDSRRRHDRDPRTDVNRSVSEAKPECPLEDVPRLVVGVVDMQARSLVRIMAPFANLEAGAGQLGVAVYRNDRFTHRYLIRPAEGLRPQLSGGLILITVQEQDESPESQT